METNLGRPILDALPAMVWTALPGGSVDFVNRRWFDYTGLCLEETGGWEWQAAIKADDLPAFLERWQSILMSGQPGEMEARVRRFDGQYRSVLFQCSPVCDDLKRVTKWCGVGTDVEDFRRAEETLRRRELDFQLIVDSMPIPVAVTTPRGEVEGLNQLTIDYFGKTVEELKEWKASEVVHPDDLDQTIAAQREAHERGSVYKVESRHLRADGTYRWFNVLGLPLRDSEGDILRWFHLLVDIDDLKRAEEALQVNKSDLGLVINTLPVMAWSSRPDGSAEFFNQQYLNYVGLSVGEPRDWDWTAAISEYWDLTSSVHPDDLAGLASMWQTILASGKPGEAEARLRRYDGEYRWFLFRANPLRDELGNITKWYGTSTDFDEQKRAEEALRESERNFRITIDTIPAPAWSARPDGSAEFLNRHYLDYIGLSTQDAQGWGWTGAVHPDDMAGLAAVWQASLASGQPGEAEARLRRFDGEYRWFLFRTSPLRGAAGDIAKWYGVNTDIDDRKQAETNLAREKHLLEMIVSGSPLRDVLSTLCKMVEEAAPGCYCDVHSIDWSGPTIEYSVAPSLPATYTDPIAGLSISGDALPCAIASQQKMQVIAEDMESDPRWLTSPVRAHVLEHGLRSVWSTPICAKDGRVLGTFCVYQRQPAQPSPRDQDLIAHATHVASIAIERSQTEAALRRSETLLAEGQQLSSTGTFSWHVETSEVTFSEELYRIFEFDPTVVVSLERFLARVHPDDVPLVSAQMDRARAGQDYSGYEIRLQMPDDRIKYLRTFGRVVHHQDGQLECLAAVQDVTELRLADEALSKARSELARVARITSLGALTASIAHEVNQPLSGIITNASTCLRMLAADPPNMEGARETARRTIRDGNRAADVITRLRALFSNRAAAIEPVDLNEATREVIALLWSDLQRSRVILRTAFADRLPLAGGDRIQLQQVIVNLLRNAADAMSTVDDRPRRLLIRTEPDENDDVRLTVQDVGVGLGSEDVGRLFQSFYTTKSDGMGIGLSVSHTIIESHNGRLWATANDGPGATFSFSVPRYSGDMERAQDGNTAHSSSSAVPNV